MITAFHQVGMKYTENQDILGVVPWDHQMYLHRAY